MSIELDVQIRIQSWYDRSIDVEISQPTPHLQEVVIKNF